MNEVACPYCSNEMRLIENIRSTGMRAYYICDKCSARSPRVRHEFVEQVRGFVHINAVPETKKIIEELAYEAATAPFNIDVFSDLDNEMSAVFDV